MRPRTFATSLFGATLFGFMVGRSTVQNDSNAKHSPPESFRPNATTSALESDSTAVVIHVVDGDTLTVTWPSIPFLEEKVRLLGIDTPERGEPFADDASLALTKLAQGRRIALVGDGSPRLKRDKYGRLLAYVLIGDVNASVEIVRQGWSTHWTEFGRGKFANELDAAERDAKQSHRGIWSSNR